MADIEPRFLRFRDAPDYLGMDRNRFNTEVRPHVTNIPIGKQGIAFDRHELDQWADQYMARHGRRVIDKGKALGEDSKRSERPVRKGRIQKWGVTPVRGFVEEPGSGTSTNASKDTVAFAKALALVTKRKQNATSDSN